MSKWIEGEFIIFEPGIDPGEGLLRVVANLEKTSENEEKRNVTFKEAAQVIFGKGRSVFIEEYIQEPTVGSERTPERQYRIAGLTNDGKPLLVVLNPRDDGGLAKRVVTAWELSRKSPHVKKLIEHYPHLKDEIDHYKNSK